MSARDLMQPIVMKVGLDAGSTGPELFTMLLVIDHALPGCVRARAASSRSAPVTES
jgi:hypothetical protein